MHCLLLHRAHERELAFLDAESARVASLNLAEPEQQQRLLLALQHRMRRALERFNAAY